MKKKDMLEGISIIIIGAILFIILLVLWVSDYQKFASGPTFGYATTKRVMFLTGLWVLYIGSILTFGYCFENKNFFFKWLMKLCNGGENKTNIPTIIIGVLGIVLGIGAIYQAINGINIID